MLRQLPPCLSPAKALGLVVKWLFEVAKDATTRFSEKRKLLKASVHSYFQFKRQHKLKSKEGRGKEIRKVR